MASKRRRGKEWDELLRGRHKNAKSQCDLCVVIMIRDCTKAPSNGNCPDFCRPLGYTGSSLTGIENGVSRASKLIRSKPQHGHR